MLAITPLTPRAKGKIVTPIHCASQTQRKPNRTCSETKLYPLAHQLLKSMRLSEESNASSEVQHFIKQCFQKMHGASIKHFLPRLLSLRNEQNELVAAFGMRAASTDKLFLENYLDEPIEEVLRRRLGVHVERHDIIEVGNLSSSYPGATRKLIVAATSLIHQEGYKWVVFTGTTAVRNGFNRLGIKTVEIGNARVNNLSEDDRALWGSYYENAPMVIAGNVELGFKMLANDLLGNDRAEGSILMAVTEIRK